MCGLPAGLFQACFPINTFAAEPGSEVVALNEHDEGAEDGLKGNNKKWRVASRTVAMFSRRAAAGLGASDEPLNEEEEAMIAEYENY